MRRMLKRYFSLMLVTGLLMGSWVSFTPEAEAKRHCFRDRHGRIHCNNGKHRGWYKYSRDGRYYYDARRGSWFESRTGRIVKGGLIGAGLGAGAGYLLDKPVGKSAVVGAGLGAGVQGVRTSRTMRRHPVVKTAAYGALAGTGVAALRRDSDPVKGALLGTAIGAGVGYLKDR